MTLHHKIVAAWVPMTVLSSKNPGYITLLPLLGNKRETYFVNFSTYQLVLYCAKRKLLEMCINQYVIALTDDFQCLGKFPPFLVSKVPVVIIFHSDDPTVPVS